MTQLPYHKSVLVSEVLHYLDPQPGGVYVDATFGGGGHTRAILEHEPRCRVIGLDWDRIAIETHEEAFKQKYGDRLKLIWGNFAQLELLLKKNGVRAVDGALADFGTSQDQIKQRAGFSFAIDSPLDMRMSPAHQKMTAEYIVNRFSEKQLRELFWELGQERHAAAIARAIIQERAYGRIKTTLQLARLIERIVPRRSGGKSIHPATQTFQALRMMVNNERENIHSFLSSATHVVKPGGTIVCISFHSLEDRAVKQFFAQQPMLDVLTRRVVTASDAELAANPSARSACLRAARVQGEK